MEMAPGEDLRVLFPGKTGSGKSTTGNTIFGRELFDTPWDRSLCSLCDEVTLNHRGHSFEIMDSPGLFDTRKSEAEVRDAVIKAVVDSFPGPHAVVFVMRTRYTEEEYQAYQCLKKLFDGDLAKHTICLFTGPDGMNGKTAANRRTLLRTSTFPETLHDILQSADHRRCFTEKGSFQSIPDCGRVGHELRRISDEFSMTKMENRLKTFPEEGRNGVQEKYLTVLLCGSLRRDGRQTGRIDLYLGDSRLYSADFRKIYGIKEEVIAVRKLLMRSDISDETRSKMFVGLHLVGEEKEYWSHCFAADGDIMLPKCQPLYVKQLLQQLASTGGCHPQSAHWLLETSEDSGPLSSLQAVLEIQCTPGVDDGCVIRFPVEVWADKTGVCNTSGRTSAEDGGSAEEKSLTELMEKTSL